MAVTRTTGATVRVSVSGVVASLPMETRLWPVVVERYLVYITFTARFILGVDHFQVYDLLANRRTVKIAAHTDDVNSCCWADTASGNVLVSASDDTFLKVWSVLLFFPATSFLISLQGSSLARGLPETFRCVDRSH